MASKRRSCVNDPDIFCYICGEYIKKECLFNMEDFIKRVYEEYFGMKLRSRQEMHSSQRV